jgi:hypothetical protein
MGSEIRNEYNACFEDKDRVQGSNSGAQVALWPGVILNPESRTRNPTS